MITKRENGLFFRLIDLSIILRIKFVPYFNLKTLSYLFDIYREIYIILFNEPFR